MATKPQQVRVYLNQESGDLLRAAGSKIPDLSEAQLVSLLVLAGLRALRANEYRVTLPLEMTMNPEHSTRAGRSPGATL